MGKIVVSQNVSLDGVVQDPTGDDGFRHGGWFSQIQDRDRQAWAEVGLDEALEAEALLLGRRSDAFFAARWSSRSGEWADRLNSLPKYVVSATLEDPAWNNSTVLKGDVVDEVLKLRHELGGEIVVYASFQLVHTLIEHDLVDELRLTIYPVVLGSGERLFSETTDKKPMRLLAAKTVGDGLAHLTFEPLRNVWPGRLSLSRSSSPARCAASTRSGNRTCEDDVVVGLCQSAGHEEWPSDGEHQPGGREDERRCAGIAAEGHEGDRRGP